MRVLLDTNVILDIQIAAAVSNNLDAIVTRDPSGFTSGPLTVLSPTELLQRLPSPPTQRT